MQELEREREIVEDKKFVYVTGSTQTNDILQINKQENYKEIIIRNKTKSESKQEVENTRNTTVEILHECCHNSNKENNNKNNNNKHLQEEIKNDQSTKAMNDVEKAFETNNNNNNMSNTLIITQTREDIVLPKIVDSITELDKKVKREISLELKEKLPKLCQQQQQQQQQKSKKNRIKSTRASKANVDKMTIKVS